ncbi:DEAD/DEAH box helicase family protein [Formicincola oecophyllae]|uniref:DEAD/DEAH box helicase family protein n=1 Tax=Formicincola oecophyllae TaxID=2558361 RepID=UPI0019CFFDA9|nr:DEAD/DEAH box helicase family protein [Formicincola oecophyllae]
MGKATVLQQDTIQQSLEGALFNQLATDHAYQVWAQNEGQELPACITDNLSRTLRDYQEEAVRRFIWLFENDRAQARHLLFNMATGTGKTVTLAALVLYLYSQGYRNFVFLVHQLNIKEQAENVLTVARDKSGPNPKYLFNPKGVKINGQAVHIQSGAGFVRAAAPNPPAIINFIFTTTSGLYNALTVERENELGLDDFAQNPTVLLADEAHHLNVETRKSVTKRTRKNC